MNQYDAIVIGARCADSPTAMLLARKGHKVLRVDRATFPSDTISTHVLHLVAVHGNKEAMDGFVRVFAGVSSPADFFSEENVGPLRRRAGFSVGRRR